VCIVKPSLNTVAFRNAFDGLRADVHSSGCHRALDLVFASYSPVANHRDLTASNQKPETGLFSPPRQCLTPSVELWSLVISLDLQLEPNSFRFVPNLAAGKLEFDRILTV